MSTRVFVYGTLLRGEASHALLEGARFVGEAITAPRYTLHDLGDYPGLVEGGATAVEGEVWSVGEELLARLDDFEGHPELFRRAPIALAGARDVVAYFWAGAPRGRVLKTGRYRDR